MALIIKKTITKVENLRSETKEINVYLKPVNVEVNTKMSICTFWAEGRENNAEGQMYELKKFVFVFDKEKDLNTQMYGVMKKEWIDSVDA